MEYAGFKRRALALLVDSLVLAPVIALTLVLFRLSPGAAIASIILTFLGFGYHVFFHARWGQTLGKMATKIKVVQVDGEPIAAMHAVLRSSVDVLLWLVFAIPTVWVLATWDGPSWTSVDWVTQRNLVGDRNPFYKPYDVVSQVWLWSEVIVLLFNKKRRALHDFVAGTVVVKIRPDTITFGIGVPGVEPATQS